MVKVAYDDVMVCRDCIEYLSNGDVPDDNPDNWSPKHIANILVCGDYEKAEEFSSRPCEECGSRLAGARFHCVALEIT